MGPYRKRLLIPNLYNSRYGIQRGLAEGTRAINIRKSQLLPVPKQRAPSVQVEGPSYKLYNYTPSAGSLLLSLHK